MNQRTADNSFKIRKTRRTHAMQFYLDSMEERYFIILRIRHSLPMLQNKIRIKGKEVGRMTYIILTIALCNGNLQHQHITRLRLSEKPKQTKHGNIAFHSSVCHGNCRQSIISPYKLYSGSLLKMPFFLGRL